VKINSYIFKLIFFGILFSSAVNAQEGEFLVQDVNVADNSKASDAFQEHFFEALKQKAIENYEKAIIELKACEKLQPNNAVVFFELGKNYKLLKNFELAISNLEKANRLQPDREWVLVELMEAYYFKGDTEQAILTVKELIPLNSKYYENLANLYFKSQQFDKLLALLDDLDRKSGINEFRKAMRLQVYATTKNTSAQIETLKEAISANPELETNYLSLILVYSEDGMEKEAFEISEQMAQAFPTSKVVHLALYKFYLNANNTAEAIKSMRIVLEAEEIDPKSKIQVLNDFLIFVNNNPSYENELKQVIKLFSEKENSPEIYQKLGEFYLINKDKQKALTYFELGIAVNLDNFELLKNTLFLQLELAKYEEALKLSKIGLEIFPVQPILYLIRGAALNKQQAYREAEEILTFGLDYVLDNKIMKIDFYEQLSIAYTGLGNPQKTQEFLEMASQLKKEAN
jgi:tetratricopeptide (TPR) repeat protein